MILIRPTIHNILSEEMMIDEKELMKLAKRIQEDKDHFICPWNYCIFYTDDIIKLRNHRNQTHFEGIEL